MKLQELFQSDIEEAKPSKAYCKTTPRKDMSASWKASCKSQGHISREGKKSHKIGHERTTVDNKIIKGKAYGGPLPDWGSKK